MQQEASYQIRVKGHFMKGRRHVAPHPQAVGDHDSAIQPNRRRACLGDG